MMNNKNRFALLLFVIALFSLYSASAYSYPYAYSYPAYSYQSSYPSYSSYTYSYSYNQQYRYPYNGGAVAMPSPCYGCNNLATGANYNSYITIRTPLDYTYYTHPELLAPREMNNNDRAVKQSWYSYKVKRYTWQW